MSLLHYYVFYSKRIFTLIEAHGHLIEHMIHKILLHMDPLYSRIIAIETYLHIANVIIDTLTNGSRDPFNSSHD